MAIGVGLVAIGGCWGVGLVARGVGLVTVGDYSGVGLVARLPD